MSKEKENKMFLKIIYFDEESAIDYINIADGGLVIKLDEIKDGDKSQIGIGTEVGIEGKFSLFNFFKANAKVEANAELLQYGESIVKSTLTNTILTDYIAKANMDKYTMKFEDYKISPITNSLAFWKMYTPYTVIFKDEYSDKISPEVDITKLDYVIDSVKGYYELVAEKEKIKIILRFNSKGFRNNYKLSNLMNMNLVYYGVLVGYSSLEQYSVEKEFDINEKELNIDEIRGTDNSLEKDKLPIYDIVLAGVTNETNR